MTLKISAAKLSEDSLDTLVVLVKGKEILGEWKKIDTGLEKAVAHQAALDNFKGKSGQAMVFYPGKPAKRIVAIGTNGKPEWGDEFLRRAAGEAYSRAKSLGAAQFSLLLPDGRKETGQAGAEGIRLASYTFEKYKSPKEDKVGGPSSATLQSPDPDETRQGIDRGLLGAEATCVARDLVNEHAGYMTPIRLADAAKKSCKGVKVTIRDEKWIEKMGMNALRAVSLGSEEPPRFVHIEYKAPGAKKSVAIVGKGITFDSGGLCIKPPDGMMEMKSDMAGAAAVVGVMSVIARVKPKVSVHGIFGATENMPGGGAYKMRDVIRAMNGKTMEITNTDAEGRVILSDALSYASTLKPDAIVDMATLTGACIVALGPKYSGIFGTDQGLVDGLLRASKEAGERVWQLPLEEEYFEDFLKSEVADMKNSGGRWGGAIQGALFLKQFVDPKIPWAHIDIAGPAMRGTEKYYGPAGASGVIVRTLLRYLESL